MKSEMTQDASDGKHREKLGSQCHSCGCVTAPKYLFPVVLSVKKERRVHVVCLECIAFDRMPKNVTDDIPRYDHLGRRIKGNEKVMFAARTRRPAAGDSSVGHDSARSA